MKSLEGDVPGVVGTGGDVDRLVGVTAVGGVKPPLGEVVGLVAVGDTVAEAEVSGWPPGVVGRVPGEVPGAPVPGVGDSVGGEDEGVVVTEVGTSGSSGVSEGGVTVEAGSSPTSLPGLDGGEVGVSTDGLDVSLVKMEVGGVAVVETSLSGTSGV